MCISPISLLYFRYRIEIPKTRVLAWIRLSSDILFSPPHARVCVCMCVRMIFRMTIVRNRGHARGRYRVVGQWRPRGLASGLRLFNLWALASLFLSFLPIGFFHGTLGYIGTQSARRHTRTHAHSHTRAHKHTYLYKHTQPPYNAALYSIFQ